jgi:PKD repeat protein
MKKLHIPVFISVLFLSSNLLAQNPLIRQWDYRYGGTDWDEVHSIIKTSDNGFILAGASISFISGDKTQGTQGDYDYWIVKTDSLGLMQWDKDFGGTNYDIPTSIQQTSDGGFIIAGISYSGISGDKTQDTWGQFDYWIVKTDSLGNKLWDKDFGGTTWDELHSIQQTSDGGFIIGGSSLSGIGGDKTEANRDTATGGTYDYWIVKTDSLGNKLWDKVFGGTDDDRLFSVQKTSDGGFILGGSSISPAGADKTQGSWGHYDYWIVKTDSLGNKQWDKDLGGILEEQLNSLLQTTDGGFILAGISASFISGDKTQSGWGDDDYWIVKTDSLGNKQWDKDFGGNIKEELHSVGQTSDGGYLLSGDSYSSISGNKSENNLGSEQTWVVKTDSLGNLRWEKTIFTNGHDETGMALQTVDGCYLIANSSSGGTWGYKSQPCWGSDDYWIIKFCEVLQAGFTAPSSTCPGSCIDFTNLSFQGTSYQWSFPGAVPDTSTAANPTNICYLTAGSYDVQLIATNANGSDTLLLPGYITVYPNPPAQGITQNGDTLFAIQGAGSYQWYFNGSIINGATVYFYVASTSGDYNVVVTDQHGCEVEAVINDVIAGLTPGLSKGEGVVLFPNPVEEKFTMHNAEFTMGAAIEIEIYNVLGERVSVQESIVKTKEETIDVSKLQSGIYYLELTSGEKIYRSQFVKSTYQ